MEGWLSTLPETMSLDSLRSAAEATGDPQLIRVCGSYLPLMYSRRHGDPSRPWNRFSIHVQDENGEPVYGYEGNWRYLPELGNAGPELPRLPRADAVGLPERVDGGRLQRLQD
jgi:hypothetical protein